MNTPENIEPIPSYGDLMTLKEFRHNVVSDIFIDEDGYGYFSDGKVMDTSIRVYPSEVDWLILTRKNGDNKHIVWFNK
jgi:hypothetical protein